MGHLTLTTTRKGTKNRFEAREKVSHTDGGDGELRVPDIQAGVVSGSSGPEEGGCHPDEWW